MPLRTTKSGDCRGTERDGTKSDTWCSLCWMDGEFVNPDCTVEEMVSIVDDAFRRKKMWFPLRWMATRQVPRLERWR